MRYEVTRGISTPLVGGVIALAVLFAAGTYYIVTKNQKSEEMAMMEKENASDEGAMMDDSAAMMKSYTVAMKEQNDSTQAGTATIVDENGKAKVSIKVAAGPAGVAQPAHIHVGACPTPGAVSYPLSGVVNGMSETTLAVSTAELLKQLPLAINIHKSKEEASTYVSCGDIVADAMHSETDASSGSMENREEAMMNKGGYETYDASKLAQATSGDVVLFFKASWCPTCRALDADIMKNLSAIPSSLLILTVNYDTATDLRKKYGVTTQHTLVQVDASGAQLKKWQGSLTLNDLVAQVQ
ncbi:MAG TPA: thioredoxin family protein [Patescibacteria group bacterium]|nr:thioredoxin family protein [Patescibacteria group bacterium]